MPDEELVKNLIDQQLSASILQLELNAKTGGLNMFSARNLADAARLLEREAIATRASRLLAEAPDEAFFAGAITNIDLPSKIPDAFRSVAPLERLEAKHPQYVEAEMRRRIEQNAETEEHFALCLKGRWQEARASAKEGVRLEEVGDTLAVLGQFDEALEISRDGALERFRQSGVLLVIAIELFRRGRLSESQAILDELGSSRFDAGIRVHLALAFAGREPWGGYPYPDW